MLHFAFEYKTLWVDRQPPAQSNRWITGGDGIEVESLYADGYSSVEPIIMQKLPSIIGAFRQGAGTSSIHLG